MAATTSPGAARALWRIGVTGNYRLRTRRPSFAATTTAAFIVIALVWGGYLGLRQIEGAGSRLDSFENLTLDWRFSLAGARVAPNSVVICAIDNETVREAEAYPLPRNVLARIIRSLAAFNPRAIALDMAFLELGKAEVDLDLVDALRSTKTVVAAIAMFERDGDNGAQLPSSSLALVPAPTEILWPTPQIRDATRVGLVNVATDQNGVPRFVPMIFRENDKIVPSFTLVAASLAVNADAAFRENSVRLGSTVTSLDLGYHLPIRFYGPRGAIKEFSAARILQGTS